MEQQGLVTSIKVPQAGKPDRKYYQLTSAGRDAFQTWLDQNVHELARYKNTNMLKLFFAGSLPKDRVLYHLQTELDLQRQQLVINEQSPKLYIDAIVAATGLQREAVMWDAINQLGIESRKTTINWLETTIERIKEAYED